MILLVRNSVLILCFCLCLPALSTAQTAQMESLTIEDGLSQGMIFDILQARDGFLWFATKDGLNRYDGYNFTVFSNDPFDPYSLVDNTVTALFEDSRDWLWVGTESKGLDLYDRRTGRFHHFGQSFRLNNPSSSYEVQTIKEAADGSIWVLQRGGGLIKIPIPDHWGRTLPQQPNLEGLTSLLQFPIPILDTSTRPIPERFIEFKLQPDGNVLVTSSYRQYLVEISAGSTRAVSNNLLPALVEGMTFDERENGGAEWVVNYTGVFRISHGQSVFFPLPSDQKPERVLVQTDEQGNVWGMINKKLWRLGPGEAIDFSKPDWEMDEMPTCVTTDRNHNVWVGTLGYGLRKFNPRKKLFQSGAVGTTVWGVWRDIRGRYFCKVVNKIHPYDPATSKAGPVSAFPDAPSRQLDLLIEPSGAMWLLCRGEEETGQAELRHYNADGGFIKAHSFAYNSYVYAKLMRSQDGNIWISGTNCQLTCFHPPTAQFFNLNYGHLFSEKANTVRAFALAEDGNGVLWIGTQQGLVKGTPNKKSYDFQLLEADANNRLGLNNNSIACLLPDPDDPGRILWIGTKGGGINRLDLRSGQFQHITTRDGLPNNVVYGIVAENRPADRRADRSFWCSTNRGLAKLTLHETPPLLKIATFTAATGLQDNEFNTQAFFKASNGELLFGGVNGLNRFYPEQLLLDTTPPPVFVVGMEINHQPASFGSIGSPLTGPLESLRELQLSHDQNNLSFEFAALDFTDPAQNRYRYRLVGLDADWVETGADRFAHFNHLAPGRYEFRVQGSNGEGHWQEAQVSIHIVVHPPWWRSSLAYLIYALLLICLGWQVYRFQIRRVQLREQLAFEHRETERVRALDQMKTNFFNNVTHEFRTPLTLIVEPVRQLLQNPGDPQAADKLQLVDRNGQRLLGLVNQLLDLAKLESGSMRLDPRHGNFVETIRGVYESFLPLAAQRGVALVLSVSDQLSSFEFDANKVELVLNNLISNALKFTSEGGKVTIECRNAVPGKDQRSDIQVSVTDTGVGIPADALNRVFERFFQVSYPPSSPNDSHQDFVSPVAGGRVAGTGIGLALSKELAELMGGGISVESEPGKGAAFTFWLPVKTSWATMPDLSPAPGPEQLEEKIILRELAPSGAAAERPIVLVVEDNAELRGFIRQSVVAHWQVVEASDGEEGVRKAIELLPDLVISDLMMPLKDGYTLCNDLKTNELTAHIPVILLTAKSSLVSRIKGLRTGADDYLTKPFNTEELLARMDNLVESHRRLRLRYSQQPGPAATQNDDAPAEFLSAPDREFLRRLTLTLEQNLSDEQLGVEEFAQKMYISRVQLHRKLKALTDASATDFIRNFRLNRAMEMLKNKEGLVNEIASQVGYGNEKYFSTVFKEKYGVSPSQVV